MPAVSVSMEMDVLSMVKTVQERMQTKSFSEAVSILVRRGYIAAVKEAPRAEGSVKA